MYKIYQVMENDTLNSIASMFGTTADTLKSLNNIDTVIPGSYIVVPNNKQSMLITYKIKRGDSLYEIANRYNIKLDDLLAINGLDKDDFIYPNQEILIPSADVSIFVTKEGDTIKDLVDYFNTSIMDIMDQNNKIYLMDDQLIMYKK